MACLNKFSGLIRKQFFIGYLIFSTSVVIFTCRNHKDRQGWWSSSTDGQPEVPKPWTLLTGKRDVPKVTYSTHGRAPHIYY